MPPKPDPNPDGNPPPKGFPKKSSINGSPPLFTLELYYFLGPPNPEGKPPKPPKERKSSSSSKKLAKGSLPPKNFLNISLASMKLK